MSSVLGCTKARNTGTPEQHVIICTSRWWSRIPVFLVLVHAVWLHPAVVLMILVKNAGGKSGMDFHRVNIRSVFMLWEPEICWAVMGSCMSLLLVSINAQIAQKRALSGRPPSLIQLFDGGLAENCNLFAFLVLLFSCIILYFFSCYGFFFSRNQQRTCSSRKNIYRSIWRTRSSQ